MRRISRAVILLTACFGLSLGVGNAQSTDINAPLPVRTNEVNAAIEARDLGDSRMTDHFYAFTGTPGDLLITVDSTNLNGDVDVFTTAGLRPLLKFTVYAGGSGPVTKSIYLRQRQDLILRVEARTPNDDKAVYRIHFGGAFEAISGAPWVAEENNSAPTDSSENRGGKGGRRVSSVGARIEEPVETETATTPAAAPEEPAEVTKPEATKPARTSRNRRPARGSKRTTSTKEKPAETANTGTESPATPPGENAAEQPATEKPAPRRRGSRRGTTARTVTPEPEPNTGARLVIETNDGTLIEHYMSAVRRVTVENGVVVIVGKDGKIERVLLANVVRMSIAP